MDPFIDPAMAEWLRQKKEALGGAVAADREAQQGEDRKALLMQFAQSYANKRPMPVQPRQVTDARAQFQAETGLEQGARDDSLAEIKAFASMQGKEQDPDNAPPPPEWGAPASIATRKEARALGWGPKPEKPADPEDVLEPELVARAKKAGVPTDKRKREPVIADVLAAEARGAAAAEAQTKADGERKGGAAKAADDLRKEFQGLPIYRDTVQVAQAATKIQGTSPTGPGDISLIFSYMKMVDPGSTVREGEFATAQNAGSVPESLIARYNAAIRGAKLSPDVREQFRTEARNLLASQMARYERTANEYRRLAKGAGVDPSVVVLDLGVDAGDRDLKPAETKSGRPRRTDATTGETREWDGAKWVPVGAL